MTENVTLNTGTQWNITGIEKLQELWREGVSADLIAQTLGRSEAEVRAKAGELGLKGPTSKPT